MRKPFNFSKKWARSTAEDVFVGAPSLLLKALVALLLVSSIVGCRDETARTQAHKAKNHARVVGKLRTLGVAQMKYSIGDLDGNDVDDFAKDLEALGKLSLISEGMASGTMSGYRYEMTGDDRGWSVTAVPVDSGEGNYAFFTDETGVIRRDPFPGPTSGETARR
jgi:hypothetical protein